jgi:hypothetical protein
MKMTFFTIFLAILFALFTIPANAASSDEERNQILFSAECLFKMMEERHYGEIWGLLSGKSRNSIVEDTFKAMVKYETKRGREAQYTKGQVDRDFMSGGAIAQAYWNAYLESFDPSIVLEQSRWEMGKIEKARAQIMIRYKKAERPAVLQMFKEDGKWRVGLIETFAARKR